MKQDRNRFMNIGTIKFVVAVTLCFCLVVMMTVTNLMSPSAIKFPSFALAQGQQNFTANLVGQDVVPPTNSKATGDLRVYS